MGLRDRLAVRPKLGRRWLATRLDRARGDADVLAIVRGNDGWELEPCNIDTDGDEQTFHPVDGSDPYPADGVPSDPPRLLGTPISIGYKDYGALTQVTNVRVARQVVAVVEDVGEEGGEAASSDENPHPSTGEDGFAARLISAVRAWKDRRAWTWTQGKSDGMVIGQDDDSAVLLERLHYQAAGDGPEWFKTPTDYRFDARGSGAPPAALEEAAVGIAFAPVPKLLAPVTCRIARNIHEHRTFAKPTEVGSEQIKITVDTDERTETAMADGGTIEDGPDPAQVVADADDIYVEERAIISPSDVKLLGGAQETQDKIETLISQVEAKENTPGGSLGSKAIQYGSIFLAFILGSQMAGGGGDGGGITGIVPLTIDTVQPALSLLGVA